MRAPDYNRAATLAAYTLYKLGVDSMPVQPEDLIRKCRNTRLMQYRDYCLLPGIRDEFPDAETQPHREAATTRYDFTDGKTYWLVYYDTKKVSLERLKFSLAHELGHIVMGHHGTDPAEEIEADFFAAHLLIPRPILAEFLSREKLPIEVNFYNLFNVSRSCLYMIQDSHDAYVVPRINRALRDQFAPFMARFCSDSFSCWPAPPPRGTRFINTRCYMQGYTEDDAL